MPPANQPLRLGKDDLFSPQVEDYLEQTEALRRNIPEVEPRPLVVRILYSSYFYLSVAGAVGALCAWAILEPYINELRVVHEDEFPLGELLLFPTVAGFIGLFLGAVEGIMCRNLSRAAISAIVGLGVGFGLGLIALVVAGTIFQIMANLAFSFHKGPLPRGTIPFTILTGFSFLLLMMGRAAAWAVAAISAGVGQGIALRERKVVINGLLGAVLGGLLGGLLFDPIAKVFTSGDGNGMVSRAISLPIIGILVGLFIGLVEQWTKTAWLLMKAGPLAGKQFVLYRNPTVLGSSPKADVYLFKDEAIEPRHALMHNRGGRFEIEDCNTPDGTYVNGIPVQKKILQSGDQIVLGKTVLEFSIKEAK